MASIVMHYDILHDMKRDIASRRPLLFMNPCDILRQKIMPESSYNHVVGMGPKLSGINLFRCINIIRGRRRTITYSTNKNARFTHYYRLSCLPVKYVFENLCAPCLCRHDTSSASSSQNERCYCNTMLQ